MRVYLIRHGETENNSKRIHQDGSARLSSPGLEQAKNLAQRFEKIPIDTIISSPFERAKATAEIIALQKNLGVTYSELFVERKRPSEIENKPTQNEKVLEIKRQIDDHYEDVSWHYSDEENAQDLKNRALKAKRYLVGIKSESVLVVTHGTIMRAIVSVMLFGEDLSPTQSLKMQKFLTNTNTGITLLRFVEGKWKLLTWNDYAHLGEQKTLK